MDLPKETLNKLRCHLCDNYLSVFPIHSNENGSLVCGRCPAKSLDAKRQVAYETLAAFVVFPCKNTEFGCTAAATPEKIESHEKECVYRQHYCVEKCQWKGIFQNFKDHYRESHKNLLVTTGEYFDISRVHKNKELIVLVIQVEDVFLFKLKKENTGFFADVYLVDGKYSHVNYMYELNFRLVSENILKLQEREVKSMSDVSDADKMFVDEIDLNKTNSCKLNVLTLSEMNKIPSKLELSIADEILCTVCKNYSVPPIFVCEFEHLLCHNCNSNSVYCCLCDDFSKVISCSRLDKIAATIKFPCRYPGCNVAFSITEGEKHKEKCRFKTFECPYGNCNANGKIDLIIEHLKDRHKGQYFLNTSTKRLTDTRIVYNVIIQNNYVFIETRSMVDNILSISVKHYGPKHNSLRFLIELSMESLQERIYFKTSDTILLPIEMLTSNGTSNLTDWSFKMNIIEM